MNTATLAFQNEVTNQIAYLIQCGANGTILSHNGQNWIAVKVEKRDVHTFVTIGTQRLINADLHKLTDAALLALGYRLTN